MKKEKEKFYIFPGIKHDFNTHNRHTQNETQIKFICRGAF